LQDESVAGLQTATAVAFWCCLSAKKEKGIRHKIETEIVSLHAIAKVKSRAGQGRGRIHWQGHTWFWPGLDHSMLFYCFK